MRKHVLLLSFILLTFSINAQLQTVFEKSNGKETATYQEAIAYYKALADQFQEVRIEEIGMTDSGYPLHLVTVSTSKTFDYSKAHENGDAVILINNGIHPGEPDGIEACMMLVRNLLSESKKRDELKGVTLAIIPIYNIGGALNRNSHSRANQNGPLEYGFRGNGQNLDLNRDFIKMDSKNAKSFSQIYHKVKPDILIDTHVSNGADYQYNITHLATQSDKLGGELGEYLKNEMIPLLESEMLAKKEEIIPYVNVFNAAPDKEGYTQFMDSPRYSSGYTTLFHTIGFIIETHMLKPFDVRVSATYRFIETMIEIAQKDGVKIKSMRTKRLNESLIGQSLPIDWKLDRSQFETLSFNGYEMEPKVSEITGEDRIFFNREKPFTKDIPYYNYYAPKTEVIVPKAYIIPQAWGKVIEYLDLNNVIMKKLVQDTSISVETYKIEDHYTAKTPYEAHYPHSRTNVSSSVTTMNFRKGDYWVSLDQPAGRFLVEVLEPQATDSYFNWNLFDTILQQKEHFSPYVFEEVAYELLSDNKELKEKFEKKKEENIGFAKNARAQLNYIYRNSLHYEDAHMRYPVYRVMK